MQSPENGFWPYSDAATGQRWDTRTPWTWVTTRNLGAGIKSGTKDIGPNKWCPSGWASTELGELMLDGSRDE